MQPLNLDVIFMRNWDPLLSENADSPSHPHSNPTKVYSSDPSSSSKPCAWEKDWADVRAVAKHVGIPDQQVKMVDLSREYWGRVFEPAVKVWAEGRTPNPDIACNRCLVSSVLNPPNRC